MSGKRPLEGSSRRLPAHRPPRPAAPSPQGKRGRAVRYRTCAGVDEEIFLHPSSALHSTAPEFVCYTELVRTAKRPYMAGACCGYKLLWLRVCCLLEAAGLHWRRRL